MTDYRAIQTHHDEQFGDKPLVNRALKLAEEAGEVAGYSIRESERRDGRPWTGEILKECGDTYIVLVNLIGKLGADPAIVFELAEAAFLARTWNIGDKSGDP